jgi:hypothetical protein
MALMAELFQPASTSLFDAPPPPAYLHARKFVTWCWSFGGEFRNSPDLTNLRYWARSNHIDMSQPDEAEVLEIARPMFSRRVEQAVRRAERAVPTEPTEAPN